MVGTGEKMSVATEKLSDQRADAHASATAHLTVGAFQQVASRFRSSGLFLVSLDPAGCVEFSDAAASPFFIRYVLPAIKRQPNIAAIDATDLSIHKLDCIPGATIASFPIVERRHVLHTIILVGRAESFDTTEEVLRLCSQLGIEQTWLSQQARALPAFNDTSIEIQTQLLQGMINDQSRLGTLENELETLSTQLSNTYEELSLIYQISGGMRINRSPRDFFRQACLDVMAVIGFRAMGTAVDAPNSTLEEPMIFGEPALAPEKLTRLTKELIETLRRRKGSILINDLKASKELQWLCDDAHQLLAVPLQGRDGVLGCIFAIDKNSGEFDSVDSKLLNSIANESAVYLENSILFENVRGLLMGLLHSLVNAVDAKDAYTCGHSERVALLCRLLAQEAGLSAQHVDRVYMAGLLHDVGKIGVAEAVLQKAGKLTAEEFEQIKKHPEIGARILKGIKQLEDIVPGVMHHHERYDGKGYPSGLAGEEIPLMGRLICLADCFDAMTSTRTYRKALPLEVAMTEIRRCSGTQFDPALTDIFLSIGADRIRELLSDHKRQTKHLISQQQQRQAA